MIFAHKRFMKAKVAESNSSSLLFGILMYGCAVIALLLDRDVNVLGFHVDFFTIALIVVYVISVQMMNADDSNESADIPLTV